jgi:hypothetical protein
MVQHNVPNYSVEMHSSRKHFNHNILEDGSTSICR